MTCKRSKIQDSLHMMEYLDYCENQNRNSNNLQVTDKFKSGFHANKNRQCLVCFERIESDGKINKVQQKCDGNINLEIHNANVNFDELLALAKIFKISPTIFSGIEADLNCEGESVSSGSKSGSTPAKIYCSSCLASIFDACRILAEIERLNADLNAITSKIKRDMIQSYRRQQLDNKTCHSQNHYQHHVRFNLIRKTLAQCWTKSCQVQVYRHRSQDIPESKIVPELETKQEPESESEPGQELELESEAASEPETEPEEEDSHGSDKIRPHKRRKYRKRIPSSSFKCPHCHKTYLKADYEMDNSEDQNFSCLCDIPGCNKIFYDFPVFRKHHQATCRSKLLKEAFTCEYCHKSYISLVNLESHKAREHTNQYRFFCDQCGTGFTSPTLLKKHMNSHSDAKNFKCKICSQSFKQKIQLTHHTMRHNSVTPFICDICGKGFISVQKLKRHFLNVHASRDTDCTRGEENANENELRKFSCETCGKCFASKTYVSYHVWATHNKSRNPRPKPTKTLISTTDAQDF